MRLRDAREGEPPPRAACGSEGREEGGMESTSADGGPGRADNGTAASLVYCKLCLSEYPPTATNKLHSCNCVFCTSVSLSGLDLGRCRGGERCSKRAGV
ncbi:hypothetical protein Z043_110728 [Scleropages formosus]|uniref:Uncharacterized protein n=1 Tax=Scleropages formosus TaxID=113540 RepID=A0A0P7V6I8_SCLFO|nr:hypothetical protein Z043_110728 [Scleropages formosus]